MNNNSNLNENQMDRFAESAIQYNLEKQLKARYDEILTENKITVSKKGRIITFSFLAKIAAIVVTVLGSVYLIQESFFSPSSQSLAQNFLEQTNISGNPDNTRKGNHSSKTPINADNNIGDSAESQILREANDAFVVKNYGLAISKYEELEKQNNILSIDKLYLGISHMKVGNYSKAISQFEEIKSREKINIEEIDWLLSLAYIISNQEEKAKPILEEIKREKRYKSNEAEQLLNSIN